MTEVALMLAIALLYSLGARPALAVGDGVVEGQLKNATAGGAVPAGTTVVLHVVDENDNVDRLSTTTDPEGRYRFDGLETGPSLRYLPVVEYQGAIYFARPFKLADQPRQTADITIYDATDSDRLIAYERANLLVQNVAPSRLDLMEMGAVVNAGDRTYLGPDAPPGTARVTLRFSLPPGASDLAPQAGIGPDEISPTAGGFTVAGPVVPGRHQLAFSYSLPFNSERVEVKKRVEYPTVSFNLYVPDVGLQIDSPQLKPMGQTDLGGQKFLLYSAQNLAGGSELTIRFGALPTPGDASVGRIAPAIFGVGCAALLTALVVVYRRRPVAAEPTKSRPAANGHDPDERAELERMRLLLSLARLDERYERGELPAEAYEHERQDSKRRLAALGQPRTKARAGVE